MPRLEHMACHGNTCDAKATKPVRPAVATLSSTVPLWSYLCCSLPQHSRFFEGWDPRVNRFRRTPMMRAPRTSVSSPVESLEVHTGLLRSFTWRVLSGGRNNLQRLRACPMQRYWKHLGSQRRRFCQWYFMKPWPNRSLFLGKLCRSDFLTSGTSRSGEGSLSAPAISHPTPSQITRITRRMPVHRQKRLQCTAAGFKGHTQWPSWPEIQVLNHLHRWPIVPIPVSLLVVHEIQSRATSR